MSITIDQLWSKGEGSTLYQCGTIDANQELWQVFTFTEYLECSPPPPTLASPLENVLLLIWTAYEQVWQISKLVMSRNTLAPRCAALLSKVQLEIVTLTLWADEQYAWRQIPRPPPPRLKWLCLFLQIPWENCESVILRLAPWLKLLCTNKALPPISVMTLPW